MLSIIWKTILYQPIVNLLIIYYRILFQNFGLAIIALTITLRLLLVPFTLPAIRTARKQREIGPLLDEIKEKYPDDKKKQAEEQMNLFKEHGINPAAGCLPQIFQLVVLVALYQAFIRVLGADSQHLNELNNILYINSLKFSEAEQLNVNFLNLNLTIPNLLLPILAGVSQFLLSKMMIPQTKLGENLALKTEQKSDDVVYGMQHQMQLFMPLMTVIIGWRLPSGLTLYWLVSTLASLVQYKFLQRNSAQ